MTVAVCKTFVRHHGVIRTKGATATARMTGFPGGQTKSGRNWNLVMTETILARCLEYHHKEVAPGGNP